MRIIPRLFLVLIALPICVWTQDSLTVPPSKNANPLKEYLFELDEMGRVLSGWKGEKQEMESWFFGSYAMLMLRNNGNTDTKPFQGLEAVVPGLWSDLKYLTPRYLLELAGSTLSNGKLMSISKEKPFKSLRSEEQFIIHVAGWSYLRMLYGTVGDSLFKEVTTTTIADQEDLSNITEGLCKAVSLHCGSELGEQFSLALSSGLWMDAEISKVRKRKDSLEVTLVQNGIWAFPVDVLMISKSGDSTLSSYELGQSTSLKFAKQDVDRIILDPEHKLVEYFRYNNKWPRIKDNIYVQPFIALPDWESYRITLSPSSWSDWDGDKRYGLKTSSGFGVDLWPAYPSDYRHRMSLELNAHSPYDASNSWGGRISYGHPLNLQWRLFANIRLHTYDDWTGFSAGMTKYIGEQRYLIQGPKLKYQRLKLSLERDNYGDPRIWQSVQGINIIKTSYSGLSQTRYGDRLYVYMRTAVGDGPDGVFSIFKSKVDLSGVFWNWLVGGLHFVAGSQSKTTPSPYQFTHDYAWQDNLSALPNFRGQSKITHSPESYMGLNLSGGYLLSWFQIKVFGSSMLYGEEKIALSEVVPLYAAGFGFEHKSFFTAGLYFPIWQSRPLEGDESWAWRYQWVFTWNL